MKRFTLAVLSCLASLPAFAAPIVYQGTLNNNVAVFGEISPAASSSGTTFAQFFRFYSNGLGPVTITGTRVDSAFDMSMWVLSGIFTNTTQFGSDFDFGDAAFVAFRDDELASSGPYGDPQFVGNLNVGWYTVAVTNYASGMGAGPDNMFDFRLIASNVSSSVPEPAPAVLLGLGAIALALSRRRV